MCHINILVLKEKTKKLRELNRVTAFIQKVSKESYNANKDGYGLMVLNKVFKSSHKLNLNHFQEYIKQSQIILTHQRISTSGRDIKYTQPFKVNDFIIAHNGILSDYDYNKRSDTYNFFMVFLEGFKREEDNNKNLIKPLNREATILKVLKSMLDNNAIGSYSIALKDTITNKLYYFKNSTTNIHFWLNHKYLYITTSSINDKYLRMLNSNFKEVQIKDYVIYRIDTDLSINEIATIDAPHIDIKPLWTDLKDYNSSNYGYGDAIMERDYRPNHNPFKRSGYNDYALVDYA